MKKLFSVSSFIGIMFCLAMTPCYGSYIIHLKNGQEFVTNHYWEEGDQVKFFRYGGEVGVALELVKEIEKVTGQLVLEQPETVSDAQPREQSKKGGQEQEGKETTQKPTLSKEEVLKQKAQLIQKRTRVTAAFQQAKADNNQKEKDRYWQELLDLQQKISELRERVRVQHAGNLPAWWND